MQNNVKEYIIYSMYASYFGCNLCYVILVRMPLSRLALLHLRPRDLCGCAIEFFDVSIAKRLSILRGYVRVSPVFCFWTLVVVRDTDLIPAVARALPFTWRGKFLTGASYAARFAHPRDERGTC